MAPMTFILPFVVHVFCTFCTFGTFELRLGLERTYRHGGIHQPLEKCFHGMSFHLGYACFTARQADRYVSICAVSFLTMPSR